MPRGVLPDAARVLPPAGQKVWLTAFNGALDEGQSEEEASKEAWAAVKRAGYERKSNGKWGKSMDFEMVMNEDDSFVINAPLIKIDVEKRIVGGFATLDNVDNAGDLVDAEASQEAFQKWFGNIREMHDKKAVGKAVKWEPKVHVADDGTEYNGIWVEAKISKGAEDTWQKVLDGTLGGFSIGGATLEKQRTLAKTDDGEKQVWRITKYRLTELSLVDAPCNGLARISLIKSLDGDVEVNDIVADEDTMEKGRDGETGKFIDLSPEIKNVISAVESWRDSAIRNKDDHQVAAASYILAELRMKCRCEESDAEWAEEYEEKSEDGISEGENMEKADDALTDKEISDINSLEDFTEEEKSFFRKLVDFFKTEVRTEVSGDELTTEGEGETPEMNTEEVNKAIEDATVNVSETITKSVDEKFDKVGESLTKIAEALEKVATADAVESIKGELKTEIDALVERIVALEESGAVKKSGDEAVRTAGEKIEKGEGFWSGSLLPEFLVK